MANIRCNAWECAFNGGSYCELGGDSEFTVLEIEDGECKSYEAKEAEKEEDDG